MSKIQMQMFKFLMYTILIGFAQNRMSEIQMQMFKFQTLFQSDLRKMFKFQTLFKSDLPKTECKCLDFKRLDFRHSVLGKSYLNICVLKV